MDIDENKIVFLKYSCECGNSFVEEVPDDYFYRDIPYCAYCTRAMIVRFIREKDTVENGEGLREL
jgi:hypothetical protein